MAVIRGDPSIYFPRWGNHARLINCRSTMVTSPPVPFSRRYLGQSVQREHSDPRREWRCASVGLWDSTTGASGGQAQPVVERMAWLRESWSQGYAVEHRWDGDELVLSRAAPPGELASERVSAAPRSPGRITVPSTNHPSTNDRHADPRRAGTTDGVGVAEGSVNETFVTRALLGDEPAARRNTNGVPAEHQLVLPRSARSRGSDSNVSTC